MSTKASRFELARQEAQVDWLKVLSIGLIPQRGFKLLDARLMILEIVEGHDNLTVVGVPLHSNPLKRLEQVENAWRETSSLRTIPVGIVYIGTDDDGGVNQDQLAKAAVRAAADISNLDVDEMTDSLLAMAFAIASRVLWTGPNRADKFITVTQLTPKPDSARSA
jgi:hypothetical protein